MWIITAFVNGFDDYYHATESFEGAKKLLGDTLEEFREPISGEINGKVYRTLNLTKTEWLYWRIFEPWVITDKEAGIDHVETSEVQSNNS